MEFSPIFLKLRTIAFCCISITSFVWIVLLCVEIFLQWDVLDHSERSLVLLMLFVDTITVIILIVLLMLPFRPWLDAARFLFLLLAHIGTAVAFVYWNPSFKCPTQTPDQEGVCRAINIYILMSSWAVPALLVVYIFGLSLMVYRRSRLPPSTPHDESRAESFDDAEKGLPRNSILPIMSPSSTRHNSTFPISGFTPSRMVAERPSPLPSPLPDMNPTPKKHASVESNNSRSSTRLSKPGPMSYY